MAKATSVQALKRIQNANRRSAVAVHAFTNVKAALEAAQVELADAQADALAEIEELKGLVNSAQDATKQNANVIRGIDKLLNGE